MSKSHLINRGVFRWKFVVYTLLGAPLDLICGLWPGGRWRVEIMGYSSGEYRHYWRYKSALRSFKASCNSGVWVSLIDEWRKGRGSSSSCDGAVGLTVLEQDNSETTPKPVIYLNADGSQSSRRVPGVCYDPRFSNGTEENS